MHAKMKKNRERKNTMRYVDNRIEIQYRECQILRDAAKAVLVENVDRGVLFSQKERWLRSISDIAKSMKLKKIGRAHV